MSDSDNFLKAFADLPTGAFTGLFKEKRYVVTKSAQTGGKVCKLIAEELGGTDYISLNLYFLASGALLRPCEMPEDKVVHFVLGICPEV
ncbi:MAG: hypothetical protein ACU0BB_16245 [Paracoccaceae bacterium]